MVQDSAPELDGIAAWFNTEPLTLESVKGPVILDFWNYSSLESGRRLPVMQRLWETYRDAGLKVIGVHAPSFRFEKDPDHVLAAVNDSGITYPVALDVDWKTWRLYGNMTRNRRTLIDPQGNIRYEDVGHGSFTEMEDYLRSMLKRHGAELPERCFDQEPYPVEEPVILTLASPELPTGVDGPPLGNESTQVCAPHACLAYEDRHPAQHVMNRLYLQGKWVQRNDHVEYRGEEKRDYAALRFMGSEAHLVVSAHRPRTRIGVLLDHEPVPRDLRGNDIVAEGNRTYVLVDRPRRYDVVDMGEPGVAELTLMPEDEVYVYGFQFS